MAPARRFQPAEDVGGEDVLLLGEMGDWRSPLALAREEDGTWSRAFDLPRGVYAYKLLAGQRWMLDGREPRTRASGGARNNVLVVDGAPEPLLFAAAPPWVEEESTGGLRVLFGVRRPAAAPALAYRESEVGPWHEAPVRLAFEEDEHAFFVAHLPTSARSCELSLGGFATTWTRPPRSEAAPAWWRDAIVQAILVDRFRPAKDPAPGEPPWEAAPAHDAAAGGHLEGIRRSLGELAGLGIDTLYLTPVHRGASAHRYDVVDPSVVDPALGGEPAYEALVRDARARGMRIVQDVSFAHVGRGFPAYEDVVLHGRASRHAGWFVWTDGALVHYGRRSDAPLLDLENEEVAELVLASVAGWARRGVSGLRLDMTAEVPIALGRRIRARFRELVPDGVVLGEVVPQHAWRWQAAGVTDAATDFGFHAAATALTCSLHVNTESFVAAMQRSDLLRGGDARTRAVRLLSTHDHPRLATLATRAGHAARLPVTYALLATWTGIPLLLYGEELGLRSDGADCDLEDVWPDRMPRPWRPGAGDRALHALVAEVFRARAASRALRRGSLTVLHAEGPLLVFRRQDGGEVVDVALNFGDAEAALELDDDERPRLVPLARTPGANIEGVVVTLPAHGVLIGRRESALGRALLPARARRNLVVRDQELAAGVGTSTACPSRFLFSVTEVCNLRCRHCITHAPELTRSGAARTLSPRVLDALREDLGFAEYAGFVHGGESLTSPMLFDVLAALRERRGAEPYVAHVLTNGLLLTPHQARRLVLAGVSSISVSLDGATAATNDAIRAGGRFEDVRRHLEDVLAWRRGEGVDVRLGLSFVVLQQNVRELTRFVDLAADLGVDWVKLEEGVPATPFAERSLVACGAAAVRAAITSAIDRGRERGLVMVDHTVDVVRWRCRMDDEATRAFFEADGFANRAFIHPCRTPWETVCIEPNGDVHAGDFFAPVLGNVTETSLAALWNEPAACAARAAAAASRLCAGGPVTCV
ncbi:MAG: Neopullulanase [Labilithrix sp.]|nr:Neopullulanase [Labilithrix sp.]